MKTPMEIFKKYGAYHYEDDEQSIIDAMNEYTEQQVKKLNIPAVINRRELLVAYQQFVDKSPEENMNRSVEGLVDEFLATNSL